MIHPIHTVMTEIFVFCAVGHKVVKILMKYQRKRLDNIALLVLAIGFFVIFIQIKIKKGRYAMPLQRLFQRVDVVENGFVPVLLRMEANSILFQCIGAVLSSFPAACTASIRIRSSGWAKCESSM